MVLITLNYTKYVVTGTKDLPSWEAKIGRNTQRLAEFAGETKPLARENAS